MCQEASATRSSPNVKSEEPAQWYLSGFVPGRGRSDACFTLRPVPSHCPGPPLPPPWSRTVVKGDVSYTDMQRMQRSGDGLAVAVNYGLKHAHERV